MSKKNKFKITPEEQHILKRLVYFGIVSALIMLWLTFR